jgi:hypothetical protein
MSLIKLSLDGNNLIIPVQGEFGQWHPGWGRENRWPFFTVYGLLDTRRPHDFPGQSFPWCPAQSFFLIVERLAVNAEVATVQGSIPASSDTVESEGRQMMQWWIKYIKNKKNQKNPLFFLTTSNLNSGNTWVRALLLELLNRHCCGSGSGSGSRRAKMTPKNRKQLINLIFLSTGCSLWGLKDSPVA